MHRLLILLAALVAPPAAAQSLSGSATVIDGDTIVMSGGEHVRLLGIDAPERLQTCQRGGKEWACGQDARTLLSDLVAGKSIACNGQGHDQYGRIVAACRAGGSDLAEVMVREGLAITLPQFSTAYMDVEARAKQFKLALWGSTFDTPADYRHAHPAQFAPPPTPRAERPLVVRQQARAATGWSYHNCAEARAAGAAPLYRGQPGYGAHMDGDGDGIACEPYHGR